MKPVVGNATVAQQVYAVVKSRIIDGTYGPDMRLTEVQIASEFETSRTPVREAMRLLAADGLVIFRPNSGTFVRSWEPQQIREIFELRVLVESEVARLAAMHISTPQVGALRKLQDDIESRGVDVSEDNANRMAHLNRQFHRVIAEACHNERLVESLSAAIEMPIVQRTIRGYSAAQLERSFHHHRELIDAFACADAAWAECVMSCHIHAAKHTLL